MQSEDERSNLKGTFRRLQDTTITKKILQRAEAELNETDENREKCLEELRILLKGEKDLTANTSVEFLLQFLRAKKFNSKNAFIKLKNYYGYRTLYPTIYQNYLPKQNLKIIKANLVNFLLLRTDEDCAVWVTRVGSWNPNDFDFETVLKFGILCNEKELQNPVTQISGIVTIVDLQGFSWRHLFHIPPSKIKCFTSAALDCLPIRHKAIHVINNPSSFGILFAIIKPILPYKILNRIQFHGYNMSSLHKHVPPCILPEEFGGTLGPFKNQEFYDSLVDSEEQFLEDQKYGYEVKQC